MTCFSCNLLETKTTPHLDEKLVAEMQKNHLRLIVIRHGESVHNLKHLMSSTRSPGVYLTDKGQNQIKDAADRLKDESITTIYVSPVFRTLQSAQILGSELNIPYEKIIIDDNIREQFYGTLENHSYDDYLAALGTEENTYLKAAPGGESGAELYARVHAFLEKLISTHHDETILIVTHSFVCSQIHMCLKGSFLDPKQGEFMMYP